MGANQGESALAGSGDKKLVESLAATKKFSQIATAELEGLNEAEDGKILKEGTTAAIKEILEEVLKTT
mgnify:CR=1 FL=1